MDITDSTACMTQDSSDWDALIAKHEPFILKCAAKASGRFISKSDEEWSCALEGFSKALQRFDPERGPFYPFAELLIRRSLLDYFREQKRMHSVETLEAEMPERAQATEQAEIRLEIQALHETLREYGIAFADLADASPRARKTRDSCAAAVRGLLGNPALLAEMRTTFRLPIGEISRISGVPRKILDRHRKYIIAVVEILDGEYLYLAEYVKYVKEEKR